MQSDISWAEVECLFSKVQQVAVGTIDEDGFPRISPIGSVHFPAERQGYYFEKFPQQMRTNLDRDSRMSMMAVQPGPLFWMKSLWKGKFLAQPALRLVCEAGKRRTANPDEIDLWLAKVRPFRFLKGHDMLWKGMSEVREFRVLRVEAVELGRMNP